jgi:hypothetical protein
MGSLKMNTALEYSTRVVQEGGRRCKKSTLNDLVHLTPLRIPLMNPPNVLLPWGVQCMCVCCGEYALQNVVTREAVVHGYGTGVVKCVVAVSCAGHVCLLWRVCPAKCCWKRGCCECVCAKLRALGIKGAQAWDIRERFFYTNQMLMVRWLGDWRKKWTFESWSHYFKVFAANFLLSIRSACA